MNTFSETVHWFFVAAHWSGTDGVPNRVEQHLAITAVSLGIAAAVAVPTGVVLGHFRRGAAVVVNLANAGRAIPTLGVLVLLAVGPLGIGTTSAVVALILFAIPPMLTNAYTGVLGVDPDVAGAARGMGMTGAQLLRRVELPLALPLLLAGIRTAAVQVVATATIAAYVGSGGLGRYIFDGYGRQDYPTVYAGVVLVAALALLIEGTAAAAQRRVTPGARHRSRRLTTVRPGTTLEIERTPS